MSGFSINPTTQTGYIGNVEVPNAQKPKEKPIQIVNETEEKSNKIKTLTTELTLDNFKEVVIREYSEYTGKECTFESIDDYFLKEYFNSLLITMSDKEKQKNFDLVLSNFKSKPILIAEFVNSIKDTELAKESADKIDSTTIIEINKADRTLALEIVKRLSKDKQIEYLQQIDNKFNELYTNNKIIVDKILNGEKITDPEELKIKEQLEQITQLRVLFDIGREESIVLTDEEKQEVRKASEESFKKYSPAFQNLYLTSLAEFVSKHRDSLNIEKLKKEFDKVTDGKFSEEFNKIPEKTATDETTGGFKIDTAAGTAASENVKKIQQEIVLNTPKEDKKIVVEKQSSIAKKTQLEQEHEEPSFFEKFSQEFIQDVITGKNNTYKSFEKKFIINGYKRMQEALKINILKDVAGNLASSVISVTKESTLGKFIEIGGNGKTVFITKQMKEKVEEKKDDVA